MEIKTRVSVYNLCKARKNASLADSANLCYMKRDIKPARKTNRYTIQRFAADRICCYNTPVTN